MVDAIVRKLCCLVVFLCCCFSVFSQHYTFKHILKETGLPSSYVYDAIEDEKGYMWIATRYGIVRYDGKEFRKYGSAEGFTDDGVYKIFKDSKSRLWFISLNYHLYKIENGSIERQLPEELASWMDEGDNGILYIITRSGTLLELRNDTVVNRKQIFNETIYFIKRLRKQSFVLVSTRKVLYLKGNKLTVLDSKKAYAGPLRVYELSDGRVLFCDLKGIRLFNEKDLSVKMIFPFHQNEPLCLYEDRQTKDIWLGTTHGAYKFKSGRIGNHTLEIFWNTPVMSIHKSLDGKMWFAFGGEGIYYGNFQSKHYTKQEGLVNNDVLMIRKQGPYIYTFSANSDVSIIQNHKLRAVDYPDAGASFRKYYQGGEGPLYFLTFNGHWKIDLGKIEPFDLASWYPRGKGGGKGISLIDENQVIYYANGHTSYILEQNSRVSRVFPDLQVQQLARQRFQAEKIAKCFLLAVRSEIMYSSADRGIFMVGRKNGIPFVEYDTTYASMPTDLLFTSRGNAVVTTPNNGIHIVIDGIHHIYNAENGLPVKSIKRIYSHDGFLWACSNNGLTRLQLDEHDSIVGITNLNTGNLLISDEVNEVAFSGNQVYVASNQGISVFDKQNINTSAYVPPVHIHTFRVNERDTGIRENIVLPYDLNNIGIGFRAISFSGEDILYRYMLEGVDQEFQYTPSDNIKYALGPGKYKFIVYAKTGNGEWSKIPAEATFTIEPPFWKTWWFIGSSILVGILILILVVWRIVWVSRRREEIKRKIVQSELWALRLHMNPHFIFNTLNSLQSFVLMHKPLDANDYIARFSQLIRWIMSYSDRNDITLEEELEFLNAYIELEQLRFEKVFVLVTEIDPHLDPHTTHIPPLVIQPFIENAIKYGLAGTDRRGILELSFVKQDGCIRVTVEDNGVGRDKVRQEQEFSPKETRSTGIAYTEERLKLLIADKTIKQTVTITDLYANGTPSGTRIDILIPIL